MDDDDDIMKREGEKLKAALGGKKPKNNLLNRNTEKTTFDSAKYFMEKEGKVPEGSELQKEDDK